MCYLGNGVHYSGHTCSVQYGVHYLGYGPSSGHLHVYIYALMLGAHILFTAHLHSMFEGTVPRR